MDWYEDMIDKVKQACDMAKKFDIELTRFIAEDYDVSDTAIRQSLLRACDRVAELEGDCQSWLDKAAEIAKRHVDSRARELALEAEIGALNAAQQPRRMGEAKVGTRAVLWSVRGPEVVAIHRKLGWMSMETGDIVDGATGWTPADMPPTPRGGEADKRGKGES